MDPLTIASLGSAGIGLLGSLFGHKNQPYPAFQQSPDSFKSLNFGDIDLKSVNPQLYQQLQQLQAQKDAYASLLNTRSGMQPGERRNLNEAVGSSQERLAGLGLVGSPAGEAMLADTQARLREASAQRAFQDNQALRQQYNQLGQQQFQDTLGGQNQAMQLAQGNRAASQQGDALRMQYQMGQYGNQQNEQASRNQFFSGLFNAGLGAATKFSAGNDYNNLAQAISGYGSPKTSYGSMGAPSSFGSYQPMVPNSPMPYNPDQYWSF